MKDFFLLAIFAPLLSSVVTLSADHDYAKETPLDTSRLTNWRKIIRDTMMSPCCRLIHVRELARHGSRNWGQKEIDATRAALGKLGQVSQFSRSFSDCSDGSYGGLSQEEFDQIKNWQDQLGPSQDLVDRGRAEEQFLARNYFNLFNQTGLLQTSANFTFESSSIKQAKDSAEAFRDQWDKLTNQRNPEPITVNDKRYNFHNVCAAYGGQVQTNPGILHERDLAKTSDEARRIIDKINKRLLFTSNVLSFDDIFALYEAAAYEMAVLGSSVFEPLFEEEDEAFLAYYDDLTNYWGGAYGSPLLANMSCSLTNDIFETAEKAYQDRKNKSGNGQTTSGFGFFQLEDLLPIYAAFGLFHDPETRFVGDAIRGVYINRKFDTSEIGTFAANMAFLFFHCPNVPEPFDQRVVVMVNGKPQYLPLACPNLYACPLSLIKKTYPGATGFPDKCNFENVCSTTPSTTRSTTTTTPGFVTAATTANYYTTPTVNSLREPFCQNLNIWEYG